MSIRPATAADLDAVMALERPSFGGDAWSAAVMGEELSGPHTHYVLAEEAGVVVGYAGLRAPTGARDADVQTIAVSGSVRGRGRGRALLRAILGEAAARGVRDVFLDVRADNAVAHALYASEGFVDVGRRPGYYRSDDVDAIVMKLELAGWVDAQGGAVAGSEAGACA